MFFFFSFFFFFFGGGGGGGGFEKIRLPISNELSAQQFFHIKWQGLLSLKTIIITRKMSMALWTGFSKRLTKM